MSPHFDKDKHIFLRFTAGLHVSADFFLPLTFVHPELDSNDLPTHQRGIALSSIQRLNITSIESQPEELASQCIKVGFAQFAAIA